MWFLKGAKYNGYIAAEGVFTLDEASQIIDFKSKGQGHGKPPIGTEQRASLVTLIKHDDPDAQWLWQKIVGFAGMINDQYFEMDLTYFEPLQLTEYDVSSAHYGQHSDQQFAEHVMDVKKLTIAIQLSASEDYEGGALKLYPYRLNDPFVVDREIGSAAMFRSNMIHEVDPVTKGARYSLVTWLRGPPPR